MPGIQRSRAANPHSVISHCSQDIGCLRLAGVD